MIRTRDSTRGSVAPPSSIYGKPGSLSSSSIGAEERLPKIRINPRTGFPEIVGYTRPRGPKKHDGANGSTQDGSEAASKELDDMDGRGPPSEDESDAASDATEGTHARALLCRLCSSFC